MPRFVILDFVRFVLALLVAMMHFEGYAAPHKAYLAVDFFFILSGFVLSVAYERRSSAEGFYKTYVIDRIARLYPLHVLTLVLLIPINLLFFWTSNGQLLENGWSYQDGRVYTFILNLILMQNIGLNTAGSWNSPSWSISVEIFVNMFLGLFIMSVARRKISWPYIILFSVICYAIIFSQFGKLAVIYEQAFGFINSGLLRGFAGISLGVVSYQLWCWWGEQVPSVFLAKFVAVSTAISCLLIMLVFTQIPNGDFAIIPLMFGFVTSVAIVEKVSPLRNGFIRSIFIRLGALSYGVYLIHWLVLTFTRYQVMYVWRAPIDLKSPVSVLIFLVVVIAVAAFVHHKFEVPMKAWVKKWLV